MSRKSWALILLIILSLFSILLGLKLGSTAISMKALVQALLQQPNNLNHELIWQLRFPRVLTAFITGGLLALAGVLMQALLRNPLADPYILGVSGGASVATLLAMLFSLSALWQSVSAFGGALLAIFIVFALARGFGAWSSVRLLLTGIVVASGFSAIISLILTLSPDQNLHGMLFWLLGDIDFVSWPTIPFIVLVLGFSISFYWSRQLNILSHGEVQAKSLGIQTEKLVLQLYFLSALLVSVAVSFAGAIGFVGLMVPHLMRLWLGANHRYLIPAAILAGGILLTLADTLSRIVIAPQQLPVGIITALLGVPTFLFLMAKGYQQCY